MVESLAKAQVLETRVPTAITCPHENTAMHMAIGYYLVTGKPQAVMVHVNVGTANGMNGLLNAARGHVPVLFTAGRTPTNEDGLDGHRSLDIHWTQEMFDQAGMLRESVKWDYELRNGQQLETVVDRALSIAKSEPMGPVYLSLPREVLAHKMSEFTYTTPTRQHAAAPACPNGDAVEEAAALLAAAEHPLIITNCAGRSQGMGGARRVRQRYAIPVIQYRNRYMSIASNHPMNLGYELKPLLQSADVILAVDIAVPWLPATDKVRDDAKVIHMGADPLHGYVPVRGHPCDIALACATAEGLRVLNETMAEHEARAKLRIDKRRGALAVSWQALRDGWGKKLAEVKGQSPIHPAWITHCIDEIKTKDTIVIKESPLAPENRLLPTWDHVQRRRRFRARPRLGLRARRQARRSRPVGDRHPRRRLVHVRQSNLGPLCRRRAGTAGADGAVQQPALASRAPRHRRHDQGRLRRQEPKAADHFLGQHLELPKSGGGRRRLRRKSHRGE